MTKTYTNVSNGRASNVNKKAQLITNKTNMSSHMINQSFSRHLYIP